MYRKKTVKDFMSLRDVRQHFSDCIGEVQSEKKTITILKRGNAAARIVPIDASIFVFWDPRVRATLGEGTEILDQMLRETFAGSTVMVLDRLSGFRAHPDQFDLLVEVFGGERPGGHVVKIGAAENIDREVAAWKDCAGAARTGVFLPVEPGNAAPQALGPKRPRLKPLFYPDAAREMHAEKTMSLHEAALQAVLWEQPGVEAIRSAYRQIYAEAARWFYKCSQPSSPEDKGYVFDIPKLDEGLNRWYGRPPKPHTKDLLAIRLLVGEWLKDHRGPGEFISPIDYVRYVWEHFREDGSPKPTRTTTAALAPAAPADVVPSMSRGWAHGDLHDRNVMVGVDGPSVPFVHVYDHEKMGRDNLIGWDFVKMEYEFKIRAYERVCKLLAADEFVKLVQLLEIDLAERVEGYYKQGAWPEDSKGGPSLERLDELVKQVGPKRLDDWHRGELVLRLQRLTAIILHVRHCAADYLGQALGRARRWLEEYYFLTAAYCVYAGRFENLHRRERLAGFVAAGVAAARLWWPRERFDQERLALAAVHTAEEALALPTIWHDHLLLKAKSWAQEGGKHAHEAVKLLKGTWDRFPRAPGVLRELCWACREAGLPDEEERFVEELRKLYDEEGLADEEVLMERGKQPKRRGFAAFLPKDGPANYAVALEQFREAAKMYDLAYGLRRGYYPGGNLATMWLLMAAIHRKVGYPKADEYVESARELAKDLYQRRRDWPKKEPDDDVWHAATRGECLTILGQFDEARKEYEYARRLPSCKAFHPRAMGTQLRLLLKACELLDERVPDFMKELVATLESPTAGKAS